MESWAEWMAKVIIERHDRIEGAGGGEKGESTKAFHFIPRENSFYADKAQFDAPLNFSLWEIFFNISMKRRRLNWNDEENKIISTVFWVWSEKLLPW